MYGGLLDRIRDSSKALEYIIGMTHQMYLGQLSDIAGMMITIMKCLARMMEQQPQFCCALCNNANATQILQ